MTQEFHLSILSDKLVDVMSIIKFDMAQTCAVQ